MINLSQRHNLKLLGPNSKSVTDHQKRPDCIYSVLREDLTILNKQIIFLLDSLRFILENNYFTYGENIYRQRKGMAMGTRVAPSFAKYKIKNPNLTF